MKRYVFYTLTVLFIIVSATSFSQIPITINTTIGSTGYTANNGAGSGTFITFVVYNNTGRGIILTELGNWENTSDNGSTTTLYYSSTSLSGPITGNALPATGWTSIASGVIPTVTADGVNPVLLNINFLIPAGATYRFAVHTTGNCAYSGVGAPYPSPNTFIAGGGITLYTGDYQIAGQYVGYGYSNNPRFFTGYAKFIPASPPAPVVTGGGSYCSGEDVTIKVSPPGGYDTTDYSFFWTLPGGSHSTDSVLSYPNAQAGSSGPSGLYTVYMLVDTGAGPPDTSALATVSVYIQQVPPAPSVQSLITYCENSVADTIAVWGQNIQWYSVPEGGTAVTTQPVINTGVAGSFTYYVSQVYGGCESVRVPVTVQVVPQAPPPSVTSPVSYCQNDAAVPLEAAGQNLLWYSTDTGGVGTPVVPTPSTLSQGTSYWYVTQTIDGCESIRVPVEIHVNYRPNALVYASRPYVCQGDTLLFTYYGNADGDNNVTFNWQWPSGSTVESGTGQGPYVVRFDSSGMRRVRLVADNNGCSSPEAHVDIEVRPLPVFSLVLPAEACAGDLVEVSISQQTPGIDSFAWSLDGGEKVYASETAGPYGVRWGSGGQKTVTVVGTDRTCTAAPVQDVITIRWLPDAGISTPRGTEVCAGDSILLEGVYNPDYTYQWLPEQFFPASNSYRQWARIDYEREITLQVTDIYNCKSGSSVWVKPEQCCTVTFPTAFTPNGDGRNDFFRPLTNGHQKISRFVVKNRWGQEVFETADDRQGWDGAFGGTAQDMGVYFYYIRYQCSDGQYYEDKGEVMLVR